MGKARMVAGRYQLIRPLGRGGMGVVWLCEDALAGRKVAVKELRAPDGVSEAERDLFRKRALQEARSAARLAHPNAVILHDIVPPTAADDAVYLIMEYVDGATLAEIVEREGRLSEPRVFAIALQMLSILEASHALGIVHRDIKPTVDLWGLGVTLYDAVEGRNPFNRENTAATFHAILSAELPVPTCAPPLATVIAGMLIRDPERRITTAQARQLLAGATARNGAPASAESVPAAHRAVSDAEPGRVGGAGAATQPGSPAYPGFQGWPDTLGAARPATRRRTAIITAAAVGVAVAAGAVIAVTAPHPGSSRTLTAGSTFPPAGSATATPAAPAASTLVESSAGSGGDMPSRYLGRWHGTLADNTGTEGPQAADLTITGGAVNSVVGTVSYPNVGCTYDFQLLSARPDKVMLYEKVQSGPCISEYVLLAPAGSGITENVYASPPSGGQPDFSGQLSR